MATKKVITLEELHTLARDILLGCVKSEHAHVLALQGDLGAGKTAFTKELAKELGITEEVTSPTFVIMKMYPIPEHPFFKKLIHIDAYRIEDEAEVHILGLEELFNGFENLIVIEWPENIRGIIPKDAKRVTFALDGEIRIITHDR